jgi:hypothetical protein
VPASLSERCSQEAFRQSRSKQLSGPRRLVAWVLGPQAVPVVSRGHQRRKDRPCSAIRANLRSPSRSAVGGYAVSVKAEPIKAFETGKFMPCDRGRSDRLRD